MLLLRTCTISMLLAARVAVGADNDPVIPEGVVEAPQVCLLHSEITYASGAVQPATFPYEVTYEDGRYYPAMIEIASDGRWNFRRNVNAAGWAPNGAKIDLAFLKQERGDPKLLAQGDKIMFRPFVGRSRMDKIKPPAGIFQKLVINYKVSEATGGLRLDHASDGTHGFLWNGIANRRVAADPKTGQSTEPPENLTRAPLKPTWHRALRYYETPDSHFVIVCSAEDRFLWVVFGEDAIDLEVHRSEYGEAKETLLIKAPNAQAKRLLVEYPKGKMALLRHTKENVANDLISAPAKLDIQSDLPYATIRKSVVPAEK